MGHEILKPGTNVWVTQPTGSAGRAVVIEYRGALGVGASKHVYRVRDRYCASYEVSGDRLAIDTDPACDMCKDTGVALRTFSDTKHGLSLTICQGCIDYANDVAGPIQRS